MGKTISIWMEDEMAEMLRSHSRVEKKTLSELVIKALEAKFGISKGPIDYIV